MTATVHHGSSLDILPTLPDASIDAIVTDPPYELGFMGKKWDASGIAYNVELWGECLRVLKPGGHLLAFGGTRTYHRMAVAIEDAGFEIRDSIHWLYGSGFPKSLDVSKAIDKRGGRIPWQREFAEHLRMIKPNHVTAAQINAHVATNGSKSNFWGHFIDVTSQPLLPTVEQYRRLCELLPIDSSWDDMFLDEAAREIVGKSKGVSRPGFAGETYGPDGSKAVEVDITAPATDAAKQWQGWGTALKPAHEPIVVARKPLDGTVAANVLEHGTGALNIDGCRVDGCRVGFQSEADERESKDKNRHADFGSKPGANNTYGDYSMVQAANYDPTGRWPANVIVDDHISEQHPDWARYFYCAKPARTERNGGLDGTNNHPTVKPVELMRYLVRLVTPPNGIVLDPFAGSGTTLVAAILENLNCVGIELTADYLPIIEGRIAKAANTPVQERLL